tara:strand:- start:749 stop:1030 length:282 start_codon:yes stop_codon:yes gene_type:complete
MLGIIIGVGSVITLRIAISVNTERKDCVTIPGESQRRYMTKPLEKPQKKPLKPDHPCHNCGSEEWWLRDNSYGKDGQVCGVCHPKPKEILQKT